MAFHVVMMQQKQHGLKSLCHTLTVYQKYQNYVIVSELSCCFLSSVEYKRRNSEQCLFQENYD